MRHNESKAQRAVILWWHFANAGFHVPEHLLFSVPNGGYRRPFEAKLLKEEGARSGVSDVKLLQPNKNYHGLALEMKSETGRLRPEQKEFLPDLSARKYWTAMCRSSEEAIEVISRYLNDQL